MIGMSGARGHDVESAAAAGTRHFHDVVESIVRDHARECPHLRDLVTEAGIPLD